MVSVKFMEGVKTSYEILFRNHERVRACSTSQLVTGVGEASPITTTKPGRDMVRYLPRLFNTI